MWRDRALRLQAEMENYRRRQQRAAEARVLEERERLLLAFLDVVDNLERALAAADTATDAGADGLKEGVRVTREAALRFLNQMGVEPVAAAGRAFDPNWHEAIGTSPGCAAVEPGTIATVLRPGYRLNDRLLRPARVIVAA